MKTRDRIIDLLVVLFAKDDRTHFSYCRFPAGECTCRDIRDADADTSLINDGYLDSMGLMSLIAALEVEFDIEIDNRDIVLGNFDTVAKIEKLINTYTNG